jgi:hypothetical protein
MFKIVALLVAVLCALMGTLTGAKARELSFHHKPPPCGGHCPVRTRTSYTPLVVVFLPW